MKAAILFLALLSGCATGIKMNAEEAAACKEQSCTAWTQQELVELIRISMQRGFASCRHGI